MKLKTFWCIFAFIVIINFLAAMSPLLIDMASKVIIKHESKNIKILSSYDNKDIEPYLKDYAKKNKINVEFSYMGDLDIVDELNNNSSSYDAVWISNSIWLYMLDNTYTISESKSISISPVVMGIKYSKAESLGLIGKKIYNKDLLELIKNKQIKYVMSSVTQTNTGATAYLGFLNSIAGSPEVLTEEMLEDPSLAINMKNIFSGVERVSGDENYLEEMFLNSDSYEAMLASESSLIKINQELKKANKEQLYLIYPIDGVAINDSTFAYIDNSKNKKDNYLKLQKYLLGDECQQLLQNKGRRTWYGGVNKNADKNIFNTNWGIDTNAYLVTTKYPSKSVMTKAINLYIEELRKPTHVVFCLDYSGSMYGDGVSELLNAMNYILDYEKSSLDKLQFSKYDKISVITFGSQIKNIFSTDNGKNTEILRSRINSENVDGQTDLYDAIIEGFNILSRESDEYTKTIIAMTDGQINAGSYDSLTYKYTRLKEKIPVYSITFGQADESQLQNIANLTNSKIFDGKTNLLGAFKEVRGYN
ncbi:MAG: vWA domain-containing protein [bacterium]|nr:vWA domain-containing protein [bacterium]